MDNPALVKNWSTKDKPAIAYAFAITGPHSDSRDVLLPVCHIVGSYDELRVEMHRDIDRVIDAHINGEKL